MPALLVRGELESVAAALVAAGWTLTDDPGEVHVLVILGARPDAVAATRPASAAPLLVVPPPGAGSADRAEAFAAGADDVLPEPCDAAELCARVAALLRRDAGPPPIRCGDLAIDPLSRRATRGGSALPLLPREYALLTHLAAGRGRPVSRHDLLRAVWRLPFDPQTNVVEVHMSRLRAKLDRGHPLPLLHTVRGRGYALAERPPVD